MQVAWRPHTPGLRATTGREKPTDPLDLVELGKGLLGVATYGMYKARGIVASRMRGGLCDRPAVVLERPFVMVQGFRSKVGGFRPILDHLTQDGLNGGRPYYVKGGKIFSDPGCKHECQGPEPKALVFRVVPHDRSQSPEDTANQLKEEFPAIRRFSGTEVFDVAAHSMGGLGVRKYLDENEDRLGRLMMGGTPHRGVRNATDGYKVIANQVGWAMALGGLAPTAAAALNWMRAENERPGANPLLADLNSRYDQQMARVEAAVTVGSGDFSTPAFVPGDRAPGDGLVEQSSLYVEGGRVEIFSGGATKVHHCLFSDPDVFDRMVDFYGWKPRS